MENVSQTDWAWPRLLDSLQRDISRLHETVEMMRRETSEARERHRQELDHLIEQLRQVRSELDPIITERIASKKARNEMLWDWFGRAGWIAIFGALATAWHYLTKHAVE